MEINKVTTNPIATGALEAFLKEQTPRHELDMITALLHARFMSPVMFSNPVVDGTVPSDTKIQQYVITNQNEEKFFMAFTDADAMEKWSKGEKRDFVLLSLVEILALINHANEREIKGVVIDPLFHNLTLTQEMLRDLPKRRAYLLKTVPPRFLLGRPKEEPEELEDGLRKYFRKKQKEVKEAWMLMALREGTKNPQLMLVVDYDGTTEDAKEMFPLIIEEAKNYLKKDEGMDVVYRDGKFAEEVLAKTESFYKKKAGLFW